MASGPFFYPIVDVETCQKYGVAPLDVSRACLRGGARWLQLRGKAISGADFLALTDAVVSAARGHDATVIVNDRADIAAMAGASGVHVGQEDLAVDAVRSLLGPRAVIGLSTHDQRHVDEALGSSADYVAVGPIFGTSTKETGYTARGIDLIRYAAGRGKPVVAIGGITLEGAAQVVAAGARGIAVISDVLRGDPELRTRQFIDLVEV
jgi:thiamine-phosphate pyrophosphorylase